ncbi:aldose 1-epimerase family protein [Candidatus Stoquefichus sp. SB1]|jgi:galactose mutarotase-like enzyme|uniref:aldose 1-epimerase family protein n=1 Tax=Candidatus Stoquefichus sp. SB1 TaxID=1658109 RepID=UPI00067F6513|nr:aldose 1-epimerase family protein [Candidatus Stoquefichus sp. SB1]
MAILKNDILEVELNPKGAEIIKIVGLKDGLNYMWRRDPSLWASSAPILFPIVGALQNNECRIDGKTYTMTQHGFSRHNEYLTHQLSDTCVEFELTPNEEILKQYPYLFDLKVIYTLKENQLECRCVVTNTDERVIYFQIGGHPAFACPFMENESSNDYYIEFEKNESLYQKIIDVEHRGMSDKTELLFDNERRFFVRQALFNNDAIVVKNFHSHYVTLKSLNHDKSIRFYMDNFNHLGIWTSKHVGGLLAIEPWVGHSDYVGFTGEFKEKEGVVALAKQEEFMCQFTIEINQ